MLDAEQRVVGDVEPEHLALEVEQGGLVPLPRRDGHVEDRLRLGVSAEQRVLPDRLVALDVDHRVDGLLVHQHQALARVLEGVEGARLDQRLDHPLVAHDEGDLAQEIGEPAELALGLAGRDDRLDHVAAHVADCGQAEPDVRAHRGERGHRLVDVGRQYLDAHPAALAQIEG